MNYRSTVLATLVSIIATFIVFAWYRELIIVSIPSWSRLQSTTIDQTSYKKNITLFYISKNQPHQEHKEILWTESLDGNILTCLHAWAELFNEEKREHKVTIQNACVSFTQDELMVSLSRLPFYKNDTALQKLGLIETLFKTVRTVFPTLKKIRLLVNHEPMVDDLLDFSQPWPIGGFIEDQPELSALTPPGSLHKQPCTIMINPAGDAVHPGRIVDSLFERTITAQCAQTLKKELEDKNPNLRIILTRFPGETVEPLQNATFANRLQVDCYISIHCYQSTTQNPTCCLYQYTYDSLADQWYKKSNRLTVTPLHLAHQQFIEESNCIIKRIYTTLQQRENQSRLTTMAPRAFPFKPLMGIHAPTLGIEIGLTKKEDLHFVIDILLRALENL